MLLWAAVLPVFSCGSAWLSEQSLTGLQEEENWEELGLLTMRNASSEGSFGSGEQAGIVCLYYM